ncbi:hypothetical protein MRX96_014906 [Rhipicephalus microplus]
MHPRNSTAPSYTERRGASLQLPTRHQTPESVQHCVTWHFGLLEGHCRNNSSRARPTATIRTPERQLFEYSRSQMITCDEALKPARLLKRNLSQPIHTTKKRGLGDR